MKLCKNLYLIFIIYLARKNPPKLRKALFPDVSVNDSKVQNDDNFSSNNVRKRPLSADGVDYSQYSDHDYCNPKRVRDREYEFYREMMEKDVQISLPQSWGFIKNVDNGIIYFFNYYEETNPENGRRCMKWKRQVINSLFVCFSF